MEENLCNYCPIRIKIKEYFIKTWKEMNIFWKVINILNILALFSFVVSYLFTPILLNWKVLFLILGVLLILIIISSIAFHNLLQSYNLPFLIISYLLFSFFIIILFGALYSSEQSGLVWAEDNLPLQGKFQHSIFSSSVYYLNVSEDIKISSTIFMRLTMQIEHIFSYIFHSSLAFGDSFFRHFLLLFFGTIFTTFAFAI